MNLRKIRSSSVALLVAAAVVFGTGTYTQNGGFQVAGLLILVGGLALAYNQGRNDKGSS